MSTLLPQFYYIKYNTFDIFAFTFGKIWLKNLQKKFLR